VFCNGLIPYVAELIEPIESYDFTMLMTTYVNVLPHAVAALNPGSHQNWSELDDSRTRELTVCECRFDSTRGGCLEASTPPIPQSSHPFTTTAAAAAAAAAAAELLQIPQQHRFLGFRELNN
jgi:hypothetical protein